jgi:hypothetical protein
MPRAPEFHESLFELAISEPKILVREGHRVLEDLERVGAIAAL